MLHRQIPLVHPRAMSLHSPLRVLPLIALAGLALTGCLGRSADTLVKESFNSDSTYSRSFPQPPAQACEAARRTLLSQAYTLGTVTADSVQATKNFQPKDEVHEQLILRVSCTPHEPDGSWVFVSAMQERYSLKKSSTSASVGVGVFGSISLPIGASDDSLVRVGSMTVQDAAFYKAFFERLAQYLPHPKTESKADERVTPDPAPQAPASTMPPAPPPVAAPTSDVSRGGST